jgi:hypothetical protein
MDNKENLKDIMNQLGTTSNDEKRIKGELFYLLSLFILTFEHRHIKIKNIIIKNKANFFGIIDEFRELEQDDEETVSLLDGLKAKLQTIGDEVYN